MRLFRLLLILSFFLLVTNAELVAQDEDSSNSSTLESPDTSTVMAVQLSHRWPGEQLNRIADTLLEGFQFYQPTESASRLSLINGNAGLAYKSMIFDPQAANGFRFAPSVYDYYLLKNDNLSFYQIRNPFSRVYYSMGSGKEQLFNVTHAQNISRGITLGLDLKILNSIGLYNRQKSDNTAFGFQAQFVTDNERYVVLGNYRNNRFRWRENGGIKYDSLFSDNIETDRQRITINLSDADNQIKESGVFIRQFYYFGKKPQLKSTADTLSRDSLAFKGKKADSLHRYYNPVRTNFFRHTFTYTRNSLLYTDSNPLSGFYSNIYMDSTATYDSLYYHEFVNDLSFEGGVGRTRGPEKAVRLRAGLEYTLGVYRNDTISRKFARLTTYAWLSANAFGIARIEGRIWVTQGNPFNGDKGLSALLSLPAYDNSNSWGNLTASLSLDGLQPDYLFQYHYSNHFSWENAFGQQTIFSGRAMYNHKVFKGGFNFYNLTNFVYFNSEALPQRNSGSFSVNQAWLETSFRVRKFNIEAFGIWQNASDASVLHLPDFAARLSASYSVSLFKRALHMNTGLTALYNTAFYADAYMPALRSYYYQNTVKTGSYPYLDTFINIRVKRARMYLILKHLNSGLTGYKYIMVPGYPMPDRGLRFGVSWQFYD